MYRKSLKSKGSMFTLCADSSPAEARLECAGVFAESCHRLGEEDIASRAACFARLCFLMIGNRLGNPCLDISMFCVFHLKKMFSTLGLGLSMIWV